MPSLPSADMRSISVRAADSVGPMNRHSSSPQIQNARAPDSVISDHGHHDHRRQRADDDGFGAEPVIEPAAHDRPDGGDDAGAHPEQQHVGVPRRRRP